MRKVDSTDGHGGRRPEEPTMTAFSIEDFAAGCKQAMKQGSDAKEAAKLKPNTGR